VLDWAVGVAQDYKERENTDRDEDSGEVFE
jgi:hypothetical protein